MVNIINNIQKMDQDFQKLLTVNFKTSYKSTSLYLTVTIFALNIYLFLSYLFDTYMFWHGTFIKSAIVAFAYICPKVITCYVIMQFSSLTALLCQRFKILNAALDKTIELLSEPPKSHKHYIYIGGSTMQKNGRKSRFTTDSKQDRLIELIDQLRLKHYELCDISYKLNYVYSAQLLFVSIQIFVNLLASIFYTFKHYLGDDKDMTLILIGFTIHVAVMATIQILCLTISSSRTMYEANRTGSIIHKIIPNTAEKELEFEMLFFSLQLIHHSVDYTICNMFNLDESLYISMIGAICTYLVIVVQFEFGTGEDLRTLGQLKSST